MAATADVPEDPRSLRRTQSGRGPVNRALRWLRANLFSSVANSLTTLVLLALVIKGLAGLAQWGIWDAVWETPGNDSSACRAVRGVGACWAVIPEKYRFILFGTYPFDQQWRPALAVVVFIALFYLSTRRFLWRRELVYLWIAALVLIGVLMWGGVLGLPFVSQERWGGLPVTLILATFGLAFGFPLGILVALGRRSQLPAIRSLCVLYVELIRGVPLISLLFMASVMFPLFMPGGFNIDKLLRAQIAIVLFAGAYLAEVIRGGQVVSPEFTALIVGLVTYTATYIAEIVRSGIQAVPRGQWDAATALGLRRSFMLRHIVLPQALRVIVPPLTSQYLNLTKNSSLAVAIGYQDIVSVANTTLNQTGQAIEAIALIMAVFLTISLSISFLMNWYNARIALVER